MLSQENGRQKSGISLSILLLVGSVVLALFVSSILLMLNPETIQENARWALMTIILSIFVVAGLLVRSRFRQR